MPQNNYNRQEKQRNNPFSPKPSGNGGGNEPKKVKFGSYWAFIIILAIMLALQFMDPFGTSSNKTTFQDFKVMIEKGDVQRAC